MDLVCIDGGKEDDDQRGWLGYPNWGIEEVVGGLMSFSLLRMDGSLQMRSMSLSVGACSTFFFFTLLSFSLPDLPF